MIPSLNWYCLHTEASQIFEEKDGIGCRVHEEIHYECPLALIPLCKAELTTQRTKVLNNLSFQNF